MCKDNKVHRIVPALMLYEDIRDKLGNDGILRPIAKDSDQIWQQMKLENFDNLITNKSLYMKAHSEYSDYDERKIPKYIDTCYKTSKDKDRLEKALEEIENQVYISCWYSSSNLSDVVFKQYSDDGIAIGTDVGTFIECINDALNSLSNPNAKGCKCYVGNIQYIYSKELSEGNIFENTQIICPLFLKGMQFKADNEFRLCVLKESTEKTESTENTEDANGNNIKEEICCGIGNLTEKELSNLTEKELSNGSRKNISITLANADDAIEIINRKLDAKSFDLTINFKKLIKRVAFKNDGIYSRLETSKLEKIVNYKVYDLGLRVKSNSDQKKLKDGFIIFELEEF